MTSPDQWSSGRPDSGWGDMREMADEFIGEFFGNWLSGNYTPFDTFQDAQRSVEWRLNELEKVSGYCNLVMSKNWNVNGGGLNGYARAIPSIPRWARSRRTRVRSRASSTAPGTSDTASSSRKQGTWRLDAQVTTDGRGSMDAGIPAQIYLSAWNKGHPDPVLERRFDATLEYIKVSNTISHTIVVPQSLAGRDRGLRLLRPRPRRWMVLGGDRWSG
ncbi:hypothetical protein GS452_25765 [Rhodococcus hoagii]|nr:hypothetical protein [Prescottella equi]